MPDAKMPKKAWRAKIEEVSCLERLPELFKPVGHIFLQSGRSACAFAMKSGSLWRPWSSWSMWRPLRVLVLFLLVGYFVSKIIDSSRKLQDQKIGVSFERIREELVEVSAHC